VHAVDGGASWVEDCGLGFTGIVETDERNATRMTKKCWFGVRGVRRGSCSYILFLVSLLFSPESMYRRGQNINCVLVFGV
jgi:hypothetical protein